MAKGTRRRQTTQELLLIAGGQILEYGGYKNKLMHVKTERASHPEPFSRRNPAATNLCLRLLATTLYTRY